MIYSRQDKTLPGFSCAIYIYIITRNRVLDVNSVLLSYAISIILRLDQYL